MGKSAQIRDARQKFDKTIAAAHEKLKKDLHLFVRNSAINAEKILVNQESIELKNMEKELEKTETE